MYKDVTILDCMILQCKLLGANSIIFVCRPEQMPYLKSRYGDVIVFFKDEIILKTITMLYVTVASRYFKKYDSVMFNMVYGAKVFKDAIFDSFGVEYASQFLLIDPRLLMDPMATVKYFEIIRKYFTMNLKSDMLFEHNDNIFPYHSYSFISPSTITALWTKIREKVIQKTTPEDFSTLTLTDLYKEIKTPDRVFKFQSNLYKLGMWKDYVALLNFMNECTEDEREFFYRRCQFSKQTLSFRRTYRDFEITTPFSQKIVDFNSESKNWYKKRQAIRDNKDE